MEKEGETQVSKTTKSDIHNPQGVDASPSDATTSVNINEAEKSALALKAHADRNLGQVQITKVAWPQPKEDRS